MVDPRRFDARDATEEAGDDSGGGTELVPSPLNAVELVEAGNQTWGVVHQLKRACLHHFLDRFCTDDHCV